MGSSHHGFYPNERYFQDRGYKTSRIIKYFSKETRKKNEFIYLKLVVILIFCNEKVPFIDFLSKI